MLKLDESSQNELLYVPLSSYEKKNNQKSSFLKENPYSEHFCANVDDKLGFPQ